MGNLKNKPQKNKIDGKGTSNQGCCSEQYPWFSFRYLTTNKQYNLNNIKTGSDRESTLFGLFNKLSELSSQSWRYWLQQPKKSGFETISFSQINFSPNINAPKLTDDTSLYVIRFDTHCGNKQGRIIGFKDNPCATFHIIGYDIDFSAYDHGS